MEDFPHFFDKIETYKSKLPTSEKERLEIAKFLKEFKEYSILNRGSEMPEVAIKIFDDLIKEFNTKKFNKNEHIDIKDIKEHIVPVSLEHKKLSTIPKDLYNEHIDFKEDKSIIKSFMLKTNIETTRELTKIDVSILIRLYAFFEKCGVNKKFTLSSFVKKILNTNKPAQKQLMKYKEIIENLRNIDIKIECSDNTILTRRLLPVDYNEIRKNGKYTQEIFFTNKPILYEHSIEKFKQFTKIEFEKISTDIIPEKHLPVIDFLVLRLWGKNGLIGWNEKKKCNRILFESYYSELGIKKRNHVTYKKIIVERIEEMKKTEKIKDYKTTSKYIDIWK